MTAEFYIPHPAVIKKNFDTFTPSLRIIILQTIVIQYHLFSARGDEGRGCIYHPRLTVQPPISSDRSTTSCAARKPLEILGGRPPWTATSPQPETLPPGHQTGQHPGGCRRGGRPL